MNGEVPTADVLVVNYYDDYKNIPAVFSYPTKLAYTARDGYGKRYDNAKGLLVCSRIKTIDQAGTIHSEGREIATAFYYDERGRIIQTHSTNHLEGVESEYIAYNFTGQPTKKMHIHQAKNKPTQMEFYAYEYDHAGRLLKTKHKLDGLPETILATNSYDELGRLKANTKGNKFATTYDYNIRSWTKSIETKNGATLLFSQKLYYNDKIATPNYPDYKESYSGNVSGMEWQLQGEVKRSNRFHYDELSRLKNSAYNGVIALKGAYNTDYTYDKHGNIISFIQYGNNANTPVDNLKMSYVGNQLNNVHNEGSGLISNSSAHFQDYSIDKTLAKQEYTYNANGAMASDLNKGISSITYNSLNLPTKLTIDNISKGGKAKGTIEYMYSASGAKLRTIHTDNAMVSRNAPILTAGVFATTDVKATTTDYVGNKIYENGELKQTLIDGGYIKDGKYYYYLTDHLGNNRAVAEATTGTLLQKTHYYPFGMAFAETTGTGTGEQEQPFKYNGKELDREMQLNTYDYAARYMDPSIGRFTSIDPHAENYYSISPYAYVANNPLKYIDPTGMDSVSVNGQNYDRDGFFFKALVSLLGIGNKIAKDHADFYGDPINRAFGNDNPTDEENFETAINFHMTVWTGMSMARSMGTSMSRTGTSSKNSKSGTLKIIEGGTYSKSELKAAQYMKGLGHNVTLRPPKGTRLGGQTSDLVVNGVNYDVYTPTTTNVSRIVSSTASKNSQTVGVVIDLSQTSVTPSQLNNILQRVQGAGATNIKDIVIIPK